MVESFAWVSTLTVVRMGGGLSVLILKIKLNGLFEVAQGFLNGFPLACYVWSGHQATYQLFSFQTTLEYVL